jgi:hypothetical protein
MTENQSTWVRRIGWSVAITGACFIAMDILMIIISMWYRELLRPAMPSFDLATLLHFCFGVYGLITGIAFVDRRRWARGALEVGCWMWLSYSVWFDVWGAGFMRGLYGQSFPVSTWYLVVVIAVTSGLAWFLGIVAIIAFLRSARVRQVFKQQTHHLQGAA